MEPRTPSSGVGGRGVQPLPKPSVVSRCGKIKDYENVEY